MLQLIGTHNCNRCAMTKTILNNKGIRYQYIQYEELSQLEQDYYFELARKAGHGSFPILLLDGEITTLQDLMK